MNPVPSEERRTFPVPISVIVAVLVVGALLLWYQLSVSLPDEVVIVAGSRDGRYYQTAQRLAVAMENELGIPVRVQETSGSLANLQALRDGSADIGLYQQGTHSLTEPEVDPQNDSVRFLCNLYPEILFLATRASEPEMTQLLTDPNTRWGCVDRQAGDYVLLQLLWDHLNLPDPPVSAEVAYRDMASALHDGTVDVVSLTIGAGASALRSLAADDRVQLIPVPASNALARRHLILTDAVIPEAQFRYAPTPRPPSAYHSVSVQAQLVAREGTAVRVAEAATSAAMNPGLQRALNLTELHVRGTAYATTPTEFTMHVGAAHIHEPDLKPLLNPDFVEGTEGLRSFVVSLLATVWLGMTWWKRRRIRSQEHTLDSYIRRLLEAERRQVDVDGRNPGDEERLQQFLDEITMLRQQALSQFTAHQLNEDRAVDCFIEMCHALSDKLNAKLTRCCLNRLALTNAAGDRPDIRSAPK